MRVPCSISKVEIMNENDREVPSVRAECSRCKATTESFGQHAKSIARCLVLMRKNCPRQENNLYVTDD